MRGGGRHVNFAKCEVSGVTHVGSWVELRVSRSFSHDVPAKRVAICQAGGRHTGCPRDPSIPRCAASAQFGPFAVGEHELCEALWPEIPDESLTIMDRNFQAVDVFWELQHHGAQRHWLVRAKANTKWKVTSSFGRWDKLVELTVSRTARRKDPTLPETLVARAVS